MRDVGKMTIAAVKITCLERWNCRPNVKAHATLSAGASVDHGVDVVTTQEHENRAADRGCCVASCWASYFVGDVRGK